MAGQYSRQYYSYRGLPGRRSFSQKVAASIGIDTEQNAPLPEGVAELVAFEGELKCWPP